MRDFLLTPYVHLWFLLSLIWWNLLLLAFSRLKACLALPIAIILGLAAGCFDFIALPLSLSRTLYFFPFFLAGFYIPEGFKKEISLKARLMAASALTAVFILTLLFWDFSIDWVLGKSGYEVLQVANITGLALRTGMYIFSSLCTLCFFVLVPKKGSRLSYLGSNTMTVYTLHYIPVYYAAMLRLIYMTSPPVTYIVILAVSIAVTVILGLIPLQRLKDKMACVYNALMKSKICK
jgi:fucose 4-O-acetylase-like acetyltransferase